MRYKVFSIRDRAANVYAQPFFAPTTAVAVRMFTDEVNRSDQNNNLFRHPEDFDLYEIGSFDDNDGELISEYANQVAIGKDVSTSNLSRV